MIASPCVQIGNELGELFTCAEVDGRVRIRTPLLYPDGDMIDLFYIEKGGLRTLTDLGETARWLRMQSTAPKRSPRQRLILSDICLTHGVEFFRGMLMVRLRETDGLADAVMRLGQACVRSSDVWFTLRTRAVESITDEVADFLTEKNIPHQRGASMPGRSGRQWPIDFYVRVPEASSLMCVLSTGSRAAARKVAEHVVATFYDLSHLKLGPNPIRCVALFDDTMDVWQEEDFRLVQDISDVARWSRPDELESLLKKTG